MLEPRVRIFATDLIGHVLRSCAPATLMDKRIGRLRTDRPTHVLAFGKASMGMTRWCVDHLGERFAGGVVLAPESLVGQVHPKLSIFPADHPTPTQRNIDATNALRAYAEGIPDDHACIVCISGGGSAHLCSPRDGVRLDEIVQTTRAMNRSGATIGELNRARKELETLKGGGLAGLLSHVAERRVFVLSDVIGDDLATIASGPMLDPDDPVEHTIVGSHADAAEAARSFLGREPSLRLAVTGDAQKQGRLLAESFQTSGTSIIAGETTVNAAGSVGIGGPCMECALACAQRLHELNTQNWVVVGLATDGIDGPTDAAGAIITPMMLDDGARTALADHDTLPYLDRIGAAFRTGATGTNVNDLVLVTQFAAEIQR